MRLRSQLSINYQLSCIILFAALSACDREVLLGCKASILNTLSFAVNS